MYLHCIYLGLRAVPIEALEGLSICLCRQMEPQEFFRFIGGLSCLYKLYSAHTKRSATHALNPEP